MYQAIPLKTKKRARRWPIRRTAMAALAILLVQTVGLPNAPWLGLAQPVQAAERDGAGSRVSRGGLPLDGGNQVSGATSQSTASLTSSVAAQAPVMASVAPPASAPSQVPPAATTAIWRGTAGLDGYIRSAPNRSAPQIGQLTPGQPLTVVRWVRGEVVETENPTWADLGNERYVYSTLLRSQAPAGPPPAPADAPTSGRWIDVNLALQVATAYEDTNPIKTMLASTGQPGWETPRGTFTIQRRMAKETMDGSTLAGQGPNGAGASYKVENVRWTQYFTADGSAFHENYWRNSALFGMPGSHGCVGLKTEDAAWLWDFAATGTPIVVH